MREYTDHHRSRTPEMVTEKEPAVVDFVNDVLRTGKCMVGGRHIVEHQQNAGDGLHDEDEQQNRAEDIGPTRAAGNRLIEHLRLNRLKADPLIDKGNDLFECGKLS